MTNLGVDQPSFDAVCSLLEELADLREWLRRSGAGPLEGAGEPLYRSTDLVRVDVVNEATAPAAVIKLQCQPSQLLLDLVSALRARKAQHDALDHG